MTIEVRQLVIKSSVGGPPAEAARIAGDSEGGLPPLQLERLKEDILAECKAWLRDKLQSAAER